MLPDEDNKPTSRRTKIAQVLKYLAALHDHRNPAKRQVEDQPWRLWLQDLPHHSSVIFGSGIAGDTVTDSTPQELSNDPSLILSVERPELVVAPPPPDELRPWLKTGWEKPHKESEFITERETTDHAGLTTIERFDGDSHRVELSTQWTAEHDEWRRRELPAYAAMELFQQLYELHGRMERESERFELVLGDGIVSWQQPDGGIYHPVLIRRVQLEFDTHVPRFSVVDLDQPTELYTSPFRSIEDVDGKALSNCREELEHGGYHPLAADASAFLKRFAITLSPEGSLYASGRPHLNRPNPEIGRSPVLFLRSRAQSFARVIEQLLNRLQSQTEFCQGLLSIVGVDAEADAKASDDDLNDVREAALPHREILFTKKTNAEQEQIAHRLEKHAAVLVQGPPGTGKSHTIANLIGHLLAHGKTVLVTSHTTKALRVLRNHVVDELRPLCVSVLDSDLESRQQLADSVEGISQRLSDSDPERLSQEAELIERERNGLLDKLDVLQSKLLQAVTNEYRSIVVAGKEYAPTEAAKLVASGATKHEWIPSPLAAGEPLPLSIDEVYQLYATNLSTTAIDDRFVNVALPSIDKVPQPLFFRQWIDRSAAVDEADSKVANGSAYWSDYRFKSTDISRLSKLKDQFQELSFQFQRLEPWQLAAVDAAHSQSAKELWDDMLSRIAAVKEAGELAETAALRHAPQLTEGADCRQQLQLLQEIVAHLERGGRIGTAQLAIHPAWRKSLKTWRVNGAPPNQIDHFRALVALSVATAARTDFAPLWDGLIGKRGGKSIADLGDYPERYCAQQSDLIRELLDWWATKCEPAIQALQQFGFQWQRFVNQQSPCAGEHGELRRIMTGIRDSLPAILQKQIARLDAALGRHFVGNVLNDLQSIKRPEVQNLCQAVRTRSPDQYEACYEAISGAIGRQEASLRREALLQKLESPGRNGIAIAINWASQIRNRTGHHSSSEPPGDVAAAWEWRQLTDELERRAALDIEQLGNQIDSLRNQIQRITTQLVDRRAWTNQLRKMTRQQRQSLIGWLDIYRRIGKGYGKRTAALQQAAQAQMKDCRDAVPVWIMPLSRAVDNFDFSDAVFDVVIIDEASQCDAMAFIALAIAKSVVVVGDHMQVSPLAVGQKTEIVESLIREHLDGIPNSVLYDGQMSIYDVARASFGATLCLTEHFRCVPDIIQFSNALSYDGRIKPLREESSSPLVPHVVPYRVEAARRHGDTNIEEAYTIASLIAAAIEHPAYVDQTFGVVSLVGDAQAFEIQKILLQHLEPEELKRRRVLCGNPAHFQGDERHVMFLSMVDVPEEGPLSMRETDRFKQRFNVAASRAQNQMWVVYSLNHEVDLRPGDLRRRLIEHALDPKALSRSIDQGQKHVESEFERLVLNSLISRQYRVVPQWKVGYYRIDLVVEDGAKRLAIECDGDRFHPPEKLADDLQRQAILERLGWTFIRLRGSEFFRDPHGTMNRVFDKLASMEIRPVGMATSVPQPVDDRIIEELKRRAAEFVREWRPPEPDPQQSLFASDYSGELQDFTVT